MARGEIIWSNGELKKHDDAKISLFTHGLHYGTGGFEGIRVYESHDRNTSYIFRLKEHLNRFLETAKIMGITLPYSLDELTKASIDIVNANNFKECYIRPIFFVDEGPLGIAIGEKPPIKVCILTWEWGKYLGDEGALKGIRLKTSSYIRPHVNSVMTKGKITGQYVTGVIAKREALSLGFDEALFLDPDGYIAEGTGENIFMIRKNKIKTTPLTSVLEGINRETAIELLTDMGLRVEEKRFTRDELYSASEVFFTGTAAEVTPIREIDQRIIGSGSAGEITQKLQALFNDVVRAKNKEYTDRWLKSVH